VAAIDLRIPGLSGLEVLAAVKRDQLNTRIVFFSAHLDSDLVYRAIASGASEYLKKVADRDEILDAVAAVSRGQVALAPEDQTGLAGEIRRREVVERPILTSRENQVLVLTADGLTAPEIPTRLESRGSGRKLPVHLKLRRGHSRPDRDPCRNTAGSRR
jgi:two-component system nitrate/nitrite response regulator NarL